ncbi:MAG: glycoside hydrolase family 16 protein [Anaeromyxobacter sp.]
MGVHPFGDPALRDDFQAVPVAIDARELHTYSAEWTPHQVRFFVDDRLVRRVAQSPDYPMQLMLNIYEFRDGTASPSPPGRYPRVFEVAWIRGWRPVSQPWSRPSAFDRGAGADRPRVSAGVPR